MKHIFKPILNILLVSVIFSGCDTAELHNLNANPNAIAQEDVNYFLTSLELSVACNGSSGYNIDSDWNTNINMCGHAIQQLSSLDKNIIGDKYLENTYFIDPTFNFYYVDVGTRAHEILRQTGPGGLYNGRKINTRNAARILKVLNFHRLTDWFGNIPYFEANMGLEGILSPKYDNQKDIYADLLKELDEATAGLSIANADEGFAYADIIYDGDISKWKKWGYSLMLRLAMRVSIVDKPMADTYVSKAVAGGVMTSNDDNTFVPMATGPLEDFNMNGTSRVFDPVYIGQLSFMSKTLIDWLMGPDKGSVADDDPRLMILSGGIAQWTVDSYLPYPGGENPLNQKGLPNGWDQAHLQREYGDSAIDYEIFSRINPKLLRLDAPFQLMNAAESEFLLAEALERGIGNGITGTAEQHYNNGVKLAMQMYTIYDESLTVSDEAVNQYLVTYPYGVYKQALAMIGEQLWVSKFLNWNDAWSDWRRTGKPVLTAVNYPGNITNGTIPRKLKLTTEEINANPNYATGATQPDELTGKVWWDGGLE